MKTSDYWDVFFDTMEKIKLRFDEESIEIPSRNATCISISNSKQMEAGGYRVRYPPR